MIDHKADIKRAVQDKIGQAEDNLCRARAAFRNLPPEVMNQEYGQSGETRSAIVAGYEADVARWKAALATV